MGLIHLLTLKLLSSAQFSALSTELGISDSLKISQITGTLWAKWVSIVCWSMFYGTVRFSLTFKSSHLISNVPVQTTLIRTAVIPSAISLSTFTVDFLWLDMWNNGCFNLTTRVVLKSVFLFYIFASEPFKFVPKANNTHLMCSFSALSLYQMFWPIVMVSCFFPCMLFSRGWTQEMDIFTIFSDFNSLLYSFSVWNSQVQVKNVSTKLLKKYNMLFH